MEKICIHEFEKQYKHELERFKGLDISKKNLDTVLRFKDVCLLNGLSKPRIELEYHNNRNMCKLR